MRRIAGWLRAQGAPAIGVHGLSLGGCVGGALRVARRVARVRDADDSRRRRGGRLLGAASRGAPARVGAAGLGRERLAEAWSLCGAAAARAEGAARGAPDRRGRRRSGHDAERCARAVVALGRAGCRTGCPVATSCGSAARRCSGGCANTCARRCSREHRPSRRRSAASAFRRRSELLLREPRAEPAHEARHEALRVVEEPTPRARSARPRGCARSPSARSRRRARACSCGARRRAASRRGAASIAAAPRSRLACTMRC